MSSIICSMVFQSSFLPGRPNREGSCPMYFRTASASSWYRIMRWSRGLMSSVSIVFKAYTLIAFLIFRCPKYLGRNHWPDTRFHSANICFALMDRISWMNPVSISFLCSSRFRPWTTTSRYSFSVSLSNGKVSNPGVSSGMSSILRMMWEIVWKSLRVGCISVSFRSMENTSSFCRMVVNRSINPVSSWEDPSLTADEYSVIEIPVNGCW